MLVDNVGAITGCVIGAIIAFLIAGEIAVIPFIIAIIVYTNAPKQPKKFKRA